MTGSDKPLEGRCGAKLRKSDPPRFCGQRPLEGRTRCKLHGGKSLQSIERPNWKHGMYDGSLPTGLAKHYRSARLNPALVALTEQIALVDGKVFELFEKAASGESPEAWSHVLEFSQDMRAAIDAFNAARKPPVDGAKMTAALATLDQVLVQLTEVATKGVGDGKLWRTITDQIYLRKKLVDSEVRRQKAAHDVLTKNRALSLIGFVTQTVLRHVKDVDAKRAIVSDLRLVMAGEGNDAP